MDLGTSLQRSAQALLWRRKTIDLLRCALKLEEIKLKQRQATIFVCVCECEGERREGEKQKPAILRNYMIFTGTTDR